MSELHGILVEDFLAEPDPYSDWPDVVPPYLGAGSCSLHIGKPWSGKTTALRALAVAVANERPWLGRLDTTPGPVLYVALDDPRKRVREAWACLEPRSQDLGRTEHPVVLYGVEWLHQINSWVSEDDQGRDGLRERFRQLQEDALHLEAPLIIVDTFQALSDVEDVSDYATVRRAFAPYVELAEKTGAHVAISHHGRKGRVGKVPDPEDALGSQAFRGSVDAFFHYTKRELEREDGDPCFTLTVWSRDGSALRETQVRLSSEPSLGTFQWPVLGLNREEIRSDRLRDELREAVARKGPIAHQDLLSAVAGNQAAKVEVIRDLVDSCEITCSGTGRRGDPKVYSTPRSIYSQPPENGESKSREPAW